MKRVYSFLTVFLFLMISCVFAEDKEGVELTIYNQNFGLVKDRRILSLKEGLNNIRFSEVASQIEPNSVHFKSLSSPLGCVIQEQNYEYDLVNSYKLLDKYIDKKIKITTKDDKIYEGILMSHDTDNIIVSENDILNMVRRQENIREISFPQLPEGLITKPTLMWQIVNDKPGDHLCEVSYLTGGISWYVDYVLVVDKSDKNIDLSGWVSINNNSGAGYKEASLKLIAGDVHRAEEKFPTTYAPEMMKYAEVAAPQFEEKAFFEYHMYTLQRKATVKDNQTKQISLLTANNVLVKKLFIYDPVDYFGWNWDYADSQEKEQKVKVKIEFANTKENNLGMPLPKGKIKVFKSDTDGSLQFIGEDLIDHTPKDETLRLYLGDAFDVVAQRKKINYRTGEKWSEESFEITVRNHKQEDIEVNVIEHLWRYSNWKITDKSGEFTKKDAQAIEFKVPVAKDKEAKVNYTVRYWW